MISVLAVAMGVLAGAVILLGSSERRRFEMEIEEIRILAKNAVTKRDAAMVTMRASVLAAELLDKLLVEQRRSNYGEGLHRAELERGGRELRPAIDGVRATLDRIANAVAPEQPAPEPAETPE